MAMLHKTLKKLRTQHGMTQEELATHLHVVRQTVSKWEKGLSVPDADTLLAIGQLFETPVSQLLGEDIYLPVQGDIATILSQQLARVNEQLAKNLARQRMIVRVLSILGLVVLLFVSLVRLLFKRITYVSLASSIYAVIFRTGGPTAFLALLKPDPLELALFIGWFSLFTYGIYSTRRK